jgi:diguanylate cyclase (GGDEF)-like protein
MNQHNDDQTSRLKHSLPVQLGVSVLVVVALAFAAALYIVTKQEERDFSEQHEHEARRIATVIAGDLAERMLAGGDAAVWREVSAESKQLGEVSGALRILVLTQDGLVKAGSDPRIVGSRIDITADCTACDGTRLEDFPTAQTVLTPDGERNLRVVNAIPNLPRCHTCHDATRPIRGYLSIDFDLGSLDRSVKERRTSMVIVGLAACLMLMTLVILLFRRLAMRSIKALLFGVQSLASGNLAARVRIFGQNELSLLARHFNRMAERLEDQVTRIAAAHTESTLLYTLVVEASKNLETTEFTSGVSKVILEKLRPKHVAFFLEGANAEWICAYGGQRQTQSMEHGTGGLIPTLHSDTAQIRMLLEDTPQQLVFEACRDRTIRTGRDADGLAFAIPVVAEAQQIGLLVCSGIPSTSHINEEMLANLGAHLALAAGNSRNYTGAITDALTGLRNRRYGMARLDDAVFAAKRYGSGLAVAMCDIDHFKRVNDTYGHPAGDAVLREVGGRIAASVRKADIAVRYGGEEFMLILPEAAADKLLPIGDKVRRVIAEAPVALSAGIAPLSITLSVGVAAFHSATDSAETLIARADGALYRAKESGRNRVEVDA